MEWATTALKQWATPLATPLIATAVLAVALVSLVASGLGSGAGLGNRTSFAQLVFGLVVRCGRTRNRLCGPCMRCRKQYQVAATCQIPFFKSIADIYSFVFGYKETGLFVEVGAYDGESFSNTSALADLGWAGHYLEPIPAFAAACARRHEGNSAVSVHCVCIGEKDGMKVELSTAGPFSSAVPDEIASVSESKMGDGLKMMGWSHEPAKEHVKATTISLNAFYERTGGLAVPGAVDVMIVDTEGMEWPILKSFKLGLYRPKLVIVEIQELQRRYIKSERAQADAASLFKHFADAGYAILYKDVVNTVFLHKDCVCVGGD